MRPWHEMERLLGLSISDEPTRSNPMHLAQLMRQAYEACKDFDRVVRGAEAFAREEDFKPAVLLAAVRELEVQIVGQPEAYKPRRLKRYGHVREDYVEWVYLAD